MVGQRSPRSTLARLLVDVIATRAVAESLYGGEVVDAPRPAGIMTQETLSVAG